MTAAKSGGNSRVAMALNAGTAPAARSKVAGESPDRSRRRISISFIVTLAIIGLVSALVLAMGYFYEQSTRQTLEQEIAARVVLEARNLSHDGYRAILSDFPELTLQPLIQEMLVGRPEMSFVVVTDRKGLIIGHEDSHRLGTPFTPPEDLHIVTERPQLQAGETLTSNHSILVATAPIVHPNGQSMGTVSVGLALDYIDSAMLVARQKATFFTAIFLTIGIAMSMVLVSWLLGPLRPLRAGIERIGQGDFDTPIDIKSRTELGVLADTVNVMAHRLRAARDETLERERLEHEVKLAQEIQQSLLPSKSMTSGSFVIEGLHSAAAEVGGDYYDYFALPNGKIGLAIADVSGKGLGGCLITSMLSALLRAVRNSHASPSALLVTLEKHLLPTLKPGSFVTMFYAILDPITGDVTYSSAGHSPTLVYRAATKEIETLCSTGIPLGIMRNGVLASTLEDRVIQIAPGDMLVQFTDGFTEAFGSSTSEQFGIERMKTHIQHGVRRGPREVLHGLHRAVEDWRGEFTPVDDETLLILSRSAQPTTGSEDEPASGSSTANDPFLALFERAQRDGHHLILGDARDILAAIRGWLSGCPVLQNLEPSDSHLLETALYELCANVAEHGFRDTPGRPFDLWWMCPDPLPPAKSHAADSHPDPDSIVELTRRGILLLRDDGKPFHPRDLKDVDLDNPETWKKGRGLGLHLIHSIMDVIRYRAGTEAGNLTYMRFDPRKVPDGNRRQFHERVV